MRQEIFTAVSWWGNMLCKNAGISEVQAKYFCTFLMEQMTKKFTTHWYEENPARGQALRALCIENGQIDELLTQAAEYVNINSALIAKASGNLVMWIDPGLVEVEFYGRKKSSTEILYQWNNDTIDEYSMYDNHVYPKHTGYEYSNVPMYDTGSYYSSQYSQYPSVPSLYNNPSVYSFQPSARVLNQA